MGNVIFKAFFCKFMFSFEGMLGSNFSCVVVMYIYIHDKFPVL